MTAQNSCVCRFYKLHVYIEKGESVCGSEGVGGILPGGAIAVADGIKLLLEMGRSDKRWGNVMPEAIYPPAFSGSPGYGKRTNIKAAGMVGFRQLF